VTTVDDNEDDDDDDGTIDPHPIKPAWKGTAWKGTHYTLSVFGSCRSRDGCRSRNGNLHRRRRWTLSVVPRRGAIISFVGSAISNSTAVRFAVFLSESRDWAVSVSALLYFTVDK